MKRLFTRIICTALAICSAFVCTACGSQQKEESASATIAETTVPQETAVQTTAAPAEIKTEADLSKLHAPATPGDLFTGYWHITDGAGAQMEHFVFGFDGNKNAYLMMGTMGFIGVYGIHVTDGRDTFSTKLMYGLNGDYTYEFSKDKKSAVLTNIASNKTTTIEKLDSFTCIPKPMENFEIDEKLLGAWADDNGAYLYFGKDGIMYNCQKNIAFTFYTYTASGGKLHANYSMDKENEEDDTYSFKDGKLIFNDYAYNRISAENLL
jgi:hypothetical protein